MRNLIFILLALSASAAAACTTVVVGRKCSATGRVIVGHNEDSFESTVRAFRVPPRTHVAGATLPAEPGRAAIPQVASTRGFYWLEVRERATGLGVSPCDAAFNDAGVLVVSNNALCRECAETNRLTAGGVFPEELIASIIADERREVADLNRIPTPAEFERYYNR